MTKTLVNTFAFLIFSTTLVAAQMEMPSSPSANGKSAATKRFDVGCQAYGQGQKCCRMRQDVHQASQQNLNSRGLAEPQSYRERAV